MRVDHDALGQAEPVEVDHWSGIEEYARRRGQGYAYDLGWIISHLHEIMHAEPMWRILMPADSKLYKLLERLDKATTGLPLDEALTLVDAEISSSPNENYRPHLEVHKGVILWGAGRKIEAVELLEQCAEKHDNESVHYFAGEYLLQLGEPLRAMHYLSQCIKISDASGDKWYQDSAYLLRAYCAAKVGNFDLVRQDLTRIDDDEPMFWISVDPVVSKASITRMVDERA
jgi:tetratricopeptide (TPR) repeat protein